MYSCNSSSSYLLSYVVNINSIISLVSLSSSFMLISSKKGPIAAYPIFLTALYYLPKSGEIWCEGGRIFLNPCSSLFNVLNAQRCLCNAITFTPQYGDSYIEVFYLLPLF